MTKAKFHFLLHLPMFIRRFGPATLFSTERYESFNHVFRLASIYSNRQAPSRDACQLFAAQDHVKHIVTGGFWNNPLVRKWVKAGPAITEYINNHPHQCRLLGFPSGESPKVGKYLSSVHGMSSNPLTFSGGAVHLPTHKNASGKPEIIPPVIWNETRAACCLRSAPGMLRPQGDRFYQVTSFTAAEGDRPKVQGHVIIKHHDAYRIGTIREILVPFETRLTSHVTISVFEFLPGLHPRLRVPCLKYATPEEMVVVPPSVILVLITLYFMANAFLRTLSVRSTSSMTVLIHNAPPHET